MDWRVAGEYLESCNCDAICPCRKVDGVVGERSTHGICFGLLGWRIDEGHAAELDLADLGVALADRYDDDEPDRRGRSSSTSTNGPTNGSVLRSRTSSWAGAADRTS